MAKFIQTVGDFRVYELDEKECKQHGRVFPTLVCWPRNHHEDIGNMSLTENETETFEEMADWCRKYSY